MILLVIMKNHYIKLAGKMRFFKRIKKLYKYFKLLIKDEDWDYSYLDELMLLKMKYMYECLSKKEDLYIEYQEEELVKSIKALRICITILERNSINFYSSLPLKSGLYSEAFKTEIRDEKLFAYLFSKYKHHWWS